MSSGAAQASIEVRPPAAALDATIRPPGSKSLSNRALLLAAMATGQSEIHGLLDADDTRHMVACLRACGVQFEGAFDAEAIPQRVQLVGPAPATTGEHTPELYVGTAGTVARFLVAAWAASGRGARVDGSARMRERPMATLITALRDRGANIDCLATPNALPLNIDTHAGYAGGEIRMARPSSSQFISALAIAAVYAQAPTTIVLEQGSPALPYITMTLEVMRDFGYDARWVEPGRSISIRPGEGRGTVYRVEPDASAASYFLAMAAIYGGRVRVPDLGRRSLQGDAAFCHVLGRFGAHVDQGDDYTEVRGTGELRGLDLDLSDMPDMTLTAAVVAAHASGKTTLRGVDVLRHHESDRIAAGAAELRKLGCTVETFDDGLAITPPSNLLELTSSAVPKIETYDDHRMAMAFALGGHVEILDPACASKTFPRYFDELRTLGMCA